MCMAMDSMFLVREAFEYLTRRCRDVSRVVQTTDGPYVGAEIARMIQQDKCALERKIVDALRGTSDVRHVQVGDVTKKELIDYFTEITKF